MPLLVTSASTPTANAHSAGARSSSARADSFASVLDVKHTASPTPDPAKPTVQPADADATTPADRSSKRRTSNDRHQPRTLLSEDFPKAVATPVTPLLTAVIAPVTLLPLGLSSTIPQDTDPKSQPSALAVPATESTAEQSNPSSAQSSAPTTPTPIANPANQELDLSAADTEDSAPVELSSVTDSSSSGQASKPDLTPITPISSAPPDSPMQPSAAASSPSLSSGVALLNSAATASLNLAFADSSPTAAPVATRSSSTQSSTRLTSPASSSSPQNIQRSSVPSLSGAAADASELPAALPAPSIDPTHTGSSSSGNHPSLFSKKTSVAEEPAPTDTSSPDNPSPELAAPLPLPAINPAASTVTVPFPLPSATSFVSEPHGKATLSSAQESSLPAATAADPSAALSKVDVARLVRSAAGSELRVGVRSEDFGNLTIHATLGRDQLSAHISTESERLGSALSNHLSSIEDSFTNRLGKGLSLRTTLSVGSETSFAGSGQSKEGERGQSSSHGAQSSTHTSTSNPDGNASGRHQSYSSSSPAVGRPAALSRAIQTTAYSSVTPDRLSIRV